MEQITLTASPREATGKGPARRLRAEGKVPTVLYGAGIENAISLTLTCKDVEKVLHTGAGSNVLVNLTVDGEDKARTVMFKEVLRDPVKETLSHIDLIEIVLGTKITVEVPLHVVGKSEGVQAGGTLHLDARVLEVECLPSRIPEFIEVDVTPLNIGESLHVSDLKLDGEIEVLADPDMTIVSVVAPTVEAEPVAAEEAAEELAESFAEKEEGEEGGEGE